MAALPEMPVEKRGRVGGLGSATEIWHEQSGEKDQTT